MQRDSEDIMPVICRHEAWVHRVIKRDDKEIACEIRCFGCGAFIGYDWGEEALKKWEEGDE